jgi:hypothetical protein
MTASSRSRRTASVALAACIYLLATAGRAFAEQSTFSLGLAPARPATAATLALHIVYRRPADPSGKPSPIRRLVFHLPKGLAINATRVPACAASDQEIEAEGPGACPGDSEVGSGTLTAITGFGPPIDPFVTSVRIFNDGHGWIEVVEPRQGGAVIAVDRISLSGRTLTGNPPATPGGPPDGQTAVRAIDFIFPASRRYITAPPKCPTAGPWRTTAAFTFADGTTQYASATTACKKAKHERPTMHLDAPRRVRPGLRTIHFRIRSRAARCRRRVLIRLAGRSTHTGRGGRATLTARFKRTGRYRVRATKAGCRPAAATISAVRH